MTMTFEQVTPDTRITCHSRGGIKGTVLSKSEKGFDDRPVVFILFDGGARAWSAPEQLSPLDEPAPAPKLLRSGNRSVAEFWKGGLRYFVFNPAAGARGYWQVSLAHGTSAAEGGTVVSRCVTRKAAFESALAKLAAS
ncbi:hypothetical protein [Streptomyces sp. AC1-42T]|uniref:hypothetical protein n=1 Tax=Streptomyces sp. AC1-42T TaxID=2218665 RepID=UPI000DAB8632|nr:hypothetical protein [Streptomyces sp. AC1-42T]PZT71522.1 hypothetical protein DNK55_32950 [Streptomyces sp. AC1-42T]